MSAFIVFCTCPDRHVADAIARDLVTRRLAACVSVLPGLRSTYRWQGAVETSDEVQLQIKTTRERFAALRDAILAQHPYELPELIAVEAAAGLDRYLDWIGASTLPAADDSSA
jgi:periplasmic divalent cation tolerance protein